MEALLTGAVWCLWGGLGLPHPVVGAEVAVHCIVGKAVALVTVQGAVDPPLLLRADELPVQGREGLVARRPYGNTHRHADGEGSQLRRSKGREKKRFRNR